MLFARFCSRCQKLNFVGMQHNSRMINDTPLSHTLEFPQATEYFALLTILFLFLFRKTVFIIVSSAKYSQINEKSMEGDERFSVIRINYCIKTMESSSMQTFVVEVLNAFRKFREFSFSALQKWQPLSISTCI